VALRIVWTRKALTDLREVFDFIARDSSFYARIEVERLQKAAARAADLPRSGRILPEFPDRLWREIRSGSTA
jgi:toxin ParE1/3/4